MLSSFKTEHSLAQVNLPKPLDPCQAEKTRFSGVEGHVGCVLVGFLGWKKTTRFLMKVWGIFRYESFLRFMNLQIDVEFDTGHVEFDVDQYCVVVECLRRTM